MRKLNSLLTNKMNTEQYKNIETFKLLISIIGSVISRQPDKKYLPNYDCIYKIFQWLWILRDFNFYLIMYKNNIKLYTQYEFEQKYPQVNVNKYTWCNYPHIIGMPSLAKKCSNITLIPEEILSSNQ